MSETAASTARHENSTNVVVWIGQAVISFIRSTGECASIAWTGLKSVLTFRVSIPETINQLYSSGVTSSFIIALSGLFVGMVVALQLGPILADLGIKSYIPRVVTIAMTRELAPIFAALLLAGRAGSGIAAELGTLRISEQIDAMRMLGLDLGRHIIGPRWLALTLSAFAMTLIFEILGMAGGYLVGYDMGISFAQYHHETLVWLRLHDVMIGLIKGTVFGAIIATVACQAGLNTGGGASGVGSSTRRAVVTASVIALVSDYFLTKALLWGWDILQ